MAAGAVHCTVIDPSIGLTDAVTPVGPGMEPVGDGAIVAVRSGTVGTPAVPAPATPAVPTVAVAVMSGTVGNTSEALVTAGVGVVALGVGVVAVVLAPVVVVAGRAAVGAPPATTTLRDVPVQPQAPCTCTYNT